MIKFFSLPRIKQILVLLLTNRCYNSSNYNNITIKCNNNSSTTHLSTLRRIKIMLNRTLFNTPPPKAVAIANNLITLDPCTSKILPLLQKWQMWCNNLTNKMNTPNPNLAKLWISKNFMCRTNLKPSLNKNYKCPLKLLANILITLFRKTQHTCNHHHMPIQPTKIKWYLVIIIIILMLIRTC